MFGLHTKNRSLVGPDLHHLRIDCTPTLVSHGDPAPAAYDDQSWITATWTRDGRTVAALVHHEYHAGEHPGRCRFSDFMACWFNAILAVRSVDGGAHFVRTAKPVVAAAPFTQEVGQGRHRGFFNPSNIVADGGFVAMIASTTGWDGQDAGACLLRSGHPDDPQSWRAFDGTAFSVRYHDPYRARGPVAPCQPLHPFPGSVGSLVRLRSSGLWLAVFAAPADTGLFPVSGFYTATSRNLLAWSDPHLLLPGPLLGEDPCKAGAREIAYPAILDDADPSRNFDASGDHPDLYYTELAVQGCALAGGRTLVRQPLDIQ